MRPKNAKMEVSILSAAGIQVIADVQGEMEGGIIVNEVCDQYISGLSVLQL